MVTPQVLPNRLIFAILLALGTLYPSAATAQTTPTKLSPAGCVSGYPDNGYQGDRPVTRNEFAAGMNTCLNQVNHQLEFNNFATQTDFDALIQGQRELKEQLRELSDRVGTLSGDETPSKQKLR